MTQGIICANTGCLRDLEKSQLASPALVLSWRPGTLPTYAHPVRCQGCSLGPDSPAEIHRHKVGQVFGGSLNPVSSLHEKKKLNYQGDKIEA